MFGVPITAGRLRLGVGLQNDVMGHYLTFSSMVGETEMLCEEAVSRLDECCPEIDPRRLNCIHQDGCGTTLEPIFTGKASDCLRDRPCDSIREQGICDGLKQLSYEPYQFQSRFEFEQEACR